MNNLGNVNLYDFYFNHHYLSEFNGIVAGVGGWKDYNLLPSRTDKTQKTIKNDGEYLLDSSLNPRTFTVPIYWQDTSGMILRNIAGWLDTPSAEDFYIAGDTMKLKCKLDSSDVGIYSATTLVGTSELKFIAYDPFFYEIYPQKIPIVNSVSFNNKGNKICFPIIEVTTSSVSTVTFHFYNNSIEYFSFSITDLAGYSCIDSRSYTIVNNLGQTLFDSYTKLISKNNNIYPYIENGVNTITVSGDNITAVTITPNFRWV